MVLILVCLSIVTLVFFVVPKTRASKIVEEYDNEYYKASFNNINFAANMIDNINKDNIVISPFNINSTLASLYSITNEDEIFYYFNGDIKKVNNYFLPKMSKYKYIVKDKTKKELYYEELINTFYDKEYDRLNNYSLNKLGSYGREELLLNIIRIKIVYDSFNNKNIKLKDIKKYSLTSTDKKMSNNKILKDIKDIIYNNSIYRVVNYVINNTNYFYNDLINKEEVKYLKDKYLVNVSKNSLNSLDSIKKVNEDSSKYINDNVKYFVDKEAIDKKMVITSSLVFNYKWDNIIDEKLNTYEDFYIDDKVVSVEMINFVSNNRLETDKAVGFIKDYEGGKYSFIGILPKYDNNLSNINIEKLIDSKVNDSLRVAIPLFSSTDSNTFYKNDIEVVHKIKFNFTNAGTVDIDTKLLDINNYAVLTNSKDMIFNKEFYYLVIDNDNNVVLLVGKVSNPL